MPSLAVVAPHPQRFVHQPGMAFTNCGRACTNCVRGADGNRGSVSRFTGAFGSPADPYLLQGSAGWCRSVAEAHPPGHAATRLRSKDRSAQFPHIERVKKSSRACRMGLSHQGVHARLRGLCETHHSIRRFSPPLMGFAALNPSTRHLFTSSHAARSHRSERLATHRRVNSPVLPGDPLAGGGAVSVASPARVIAALVDSRVLTRTAHRSRRTSRNPNVGRTIGADRHPAALGRHARQ
jgi:hypothetical protein